MDKQTEGELLVIMSLPHVDPSQARDAWGETYVHHWRYVSAVAARALGTAGRDADAVLDVVTETFKVMFEWAGRHGSGEDLRARFQASDRDGVRRRILGFLAVIARRLAMRFIAQKVGQPILHSDIEQATYDESAETSSASQRAGLDQMLEP